MRIWFDGTQDLFDYMLETHGPCKPRKHARFAIQDATRRICPVLLHPCILFWQMYQDRQTTTA
jgi:hypothetical protein